MSSVPLWYLSLGHRQIHALPSCCGHRRAEADSRGCGLKASACCMHTRHRSAASGLQCCHLVLYCSTGWSPQTVTAVPSQAGMCTGGWGVSSAVWQALIRRQHRETTAALQAARMSKL